MTELKKGVQLALDFAPKPVIAETVIPSEAIAPPSSQVVTFIDSATIEVRQEAVRRLAVSGIFAVPASVTRYL